MSSLLENELHTLLQKESSPELIAQEILSNWSHQLVDFEDSICFAEFLFSFGLYKNLIDFSLSLIAEQKKQIPWAHLTEAIFAGAEHVPDKVKKSLIDGARETGGLMEITFSERLDSFDPDLSQVRKSRKNQTQIQYQLKKQDYLDQLKVHKAQQLVEEEKKLLQFLLRKYPGDREIELLEKSFHQGLAQELFAKKISKADPLKKYRESDLAQPETQRLLSALLQESHEVSETRPESALDLAMMFWFFEDYKKAQQVLDYAPDSESKDWLYLEILFKERRYLEILDRLIQYEQKFASTNNDILFASMYLRSLCLWELGQHVSALELMQSIVQSNSNYRSAQSYVNLWKGEV